MLGRLDRSFRPGKFSDVKQTFDTFLQFDENPVGNEVDHLASDLAVHGKLLLDAVPRVADQLLEPKGNALTIMIHVNDRHGDLFPRLHHFTRMGDTAPAHVGDVEQSVETIQINESTVVGDVLHHSPTGIAGLDR